MHMRCGYILYDREYLFSHTCNQSPHSWIGVSWITSNSYWCALALVLLLVLRRHRPSGMPRRTCADAVSCLCAVITEKGWKNDMGRTVANRWNIGRNTYKFWLDDLARLVGGSVCFVYSIMYVGALWQPQWYADRANRRVRTREKAFTSSMTTLFYWVLKYETASHIAWLFISVARCLFGLFVAVIVFFLLPNNLSHTVEIYWPSRGEKMNLAICRPVKNMRSIYALYRYLLRHAYEFSIYFHPVVVFS